MRRILSVHGEEISHRSMSFVVVFCFAAVRQFQFLNKKLSKASPIASWRSPKFQLLFKYGRFSRRAECITIPGRESRAELIPISKIHMRFLNMWERSVEIVFLVRCCFNFLMDSCWRWAFLKMWNGVDVIFFYYVRVALFVKSFGCCDRFFFLMKYFGNVSKSWCWYFCKCLWSHFLLQWLRELFWKFSWKKL